MVGALADWFAVTALFKHPMGIRIPHTAIIPANQQRIAEKLGEFIERHFLDAAPIDAKLRSVDFASFTADWLANERRSTELARFVIRLLPDAVDAAANSGLRGFLAQQITGRLQALDLAPLAAGTPTRQSGLGRSSASSGSRAPSRSATSRCRFPRTGLRH